MTSLARFAIRANFSGRYIEMRTHRVHLSMCGYDKCGRKSFWKRSKTAPFSFENGLVCDKYDQLVTKPELLQNEL